MKSLIWPKESFKNFLAVLSLLIMFALLYSRNDLRDSMFVLITLIIKHYFDSTTGSQKKDQTISDMASSIPNAPNNEKSNS